jgi:hypothetical protein
LCVYVCIGLTPVIYVYLYNYMYCVCVCVCVGLTPETGPVCANPVYDAWYALWTPVIQAQFLTRPL